MLHQTTDVEATVTSPGSQLIDKDSSPVTSGRATSGPSIIRETPNPIPDPQAHIPPSSPDLPSTTSSSSNMAKAEKLSTSRKTTLPQYEREPLKHKYDDGNGNSTLTPHIKAAGESGRRGFSPMHFLMIAGRSSCKASAAVNILWPSVPAAIAVRYAAPESHLAIFILAYIAMVPCANLIGFAGQEAGRKMPPVLGVIIETTFGSLVEIVLFLVLLLKGENFAVIKAAILGSILANMLLCLGLCFFFAGMRRDESHFSETVSEAGSGLLLTAGFGLAVPTVFAMAFKDAEGVTNAILTRDVLQVSRVTAVALIIAYCVYVWFMGRTVSNVGSSSPCLSFFSK